MSNMTSSVHHEHGKLKKVSFSSLKPFICPELLKEEVKETLYKLFKLQLNSYQDDCVKASNSPFFHCIIENFLCCHDDVPVTADSFISELKNELLQMEFHPKSNDLYKFVQTKELIEKSTERNSLQSSHHLQHFSSLLCKSILPWLQDITGTLLNGDTNMFCAQYRSTDCLLCHDDELEKRRFAYVYYLTPHWSPEDGGSLDLFSSKSSSDKSGLFDPTEVVKSIVPTANSLVLFEVSPKSFHQVSEVLSSSKTRLSLTGWFHGPTEARPLRPICPKADVVPCIPSSGEIELLQRWIKPSYLNLATQAAMQEQFVEDSEILLTEFLLNEKYEALMECLSKLQTIEKHWQLCGPPNKCRYHKLTHGQNFEPDRLIEGRCVDNSNSKCENEKNASSDTTGNTDDCLNLLKELVDVFKSEEAFLFFSNITGLSFHPFAGDSDSDDDVIATKRQKRESGVNAGCRSEIRRWEKGSYTLIRDNDFERKEVALDVNLYLCDSEWEEEHGGYTSYVASDSPEELLTILPSANSLSITYRDADAMRFVKHINHTATGSFFDLSMVYYE